MLLRYLLFLLRSGNAHVIHSPFVFDLYTRVICSQVPYYVFESIENIRARLLASAETIEVTDFGAGSRVNASSRRRIRDIARYSEKNAQLGQLLFRLVNHFSPNTILDLGTSLGITTLYLASARKASKIYTFEGCPQTMAVAKQHFNEMQLTHIIPIEGNIDQTLSNTLYPLSSVDFAFFDANHRYEPTLRYFQTCLSKVHEDTILVFDDIYWSAEMAKAWEEIKAHEAVTLTVDLFYVGLVFFRTKQPKQHFRLRL